MSPIFLQVEDQRSDVAVAAINSKPLHLREQVILCFRLQLFAFPAIT